MGAGDTECRQVTLPVLVVGERLGRRLEQRVRLLGALSREQARDELRGCDCFVLPSRHESFGVVLAEATACGRPVISTRCGGPESIVTKENGILVEKNRGWSWSKSDRPRVTIESGAVVNGTLQFEREVELYVGAGAVIGPVEGVAPQRHSLP